MNRFEQVLFNGHVVGFWYFDSENNELLIGIKRYKKYKKDLFKIVEADLVEAEEVVKKYINDEK